MLGSVCRVSDSVFPSEDWPAIGFFPCPCCNCGSGHRALPVVHHQAGLLVLPQFLIDLFELHKEVLVLVFHIYARFLAGVHWCGLYHLQLDDSWDLVQPCFVVGVGPDVGLYKFG